MGWWDGKSEAQEKSEQAQADNERGQRDGSRGSGFDHFYHHATDHNNSPEYNAGYENGENNPAADNDGSGSPGGSGCFLTTACVDSIGLPDDCEELTMLRWLRDNFIRRQKGGAEEVAEYYRVAPQITARIDASAERRTVYRGIYDGLVLPAVQMIRANRYQDAYELYKTWFQQLRAQWI